MGYWFICVDRAREYNPRAILQKTPWHHMVINYPENSPTRALRALMDELSFGEKYIPNWNIDRFYIQPCSIPLVKGWRKVASYMASYNWFCPDNIYQDYTGYTGHDLMNQSWFYVAKESRKTFPAIFSSY